MVIHWMVYIHLRCSKNHFAPWRCHFVFQKFQNYIFDLPVGTVVMTELSIKSEEPFPPLAQEETQIVMIAILKKIFYVGITHSYLL